MISPQFVVADVVVAAEYYRGVFRFCIFGYFLDPPGLCSRRTSFGRNSFFGKNGHWHRRYKCYEIFVEDYSGFHLAFAVDLGSHPAVPHAPEPFAKELFPHTRVLK